TRRPSAGQVSAAYGAWPRRLIHPDRRRRGEPAIRAHTADAVPRVLRVRRLAFALVALKEAGHEELAGERGELDAPGLAVADELVLIVEVDDLHHRARLRRIVGDLVAVLR